MSKDEIDNIRAVTFGPKHHFFGFHDLCPWDESEKYMLAMETDFIDRSPTADDKARIGLIDSTNNNKFNVIAETRAWNFHQGCRAQWLPKDPQKIIYNDRRNEKFVSVIFDTKTKKEVKVLDYPIYAISPKGEFGLGLNFARLQKYGGYGYPVKSDKESDHGASRSDVSINNPFPRDDGIFKVDLKTGETKLLISIHDVACLNNTPREDEHHILIHIDFNPSGSRICFSDKFRLPDGGFWNRFLTANPDGTDLYVLLGHISHFDWYNDEEIFGFGKSSTRMMRFRKKGISQNFLLRPFLKIAREMRGRLKQVVAAQGYFLFKDHSQEVQKIAVGVLTEDGHPAFSPDRRWVIADTYPNKNHERALILYNWGNKKRVDLGKFRSLPQGVDSSWDISQMRSDLHPRWNRTGTEICIDSVHEDSRQMYVVDVGDIVT